MQLLLSIEIVHILILTGMGKCNQWVKQINEKLDWGRGFASRYLPGKVHRSYYFASPVSLKYFAAIDGICKVFSLAGPPSTDVPAILYPRGLHVSDSDLRHFKLIQSNLSVSV